MNPIDVAMALSDTELLVALERLARREREAKEELAAVRAELRTRRARRREQRGGDRRPSRNTGRTARAR